jgi:DNA transformation protein
VAVSNDYIEYVREQLASLGRVTSRRMFGGVGLYANGLFFAILDGDQLYFKTDDSNRADYEARGSKPFCPFPDKPEMKMNYHDVPADLLEDAEELCRWAKKAVAVALSAASKKKSPVRSRKKAVKSTQDLSKKSLRRATKRR